MTTTNPRRGYGQRRVTRKQASGPERTAAHRRAKNEPTSEHTRATTVDIGATTSKGGKQ